MLKPTNYDNLIVDDYSPIKLGGHYLEIIDVKESISRSGNPLLVIHFDFAENSMVFAVSSKDKKGISDLKDAISEIILNIS